MEEGQQDELYARLLSLGFEEDACQRAAYVEKFQSPDEAATWIMDGAQAPDASLLRLRPDSATEAADFVDKQSSMEQTTFAAPQPSPVRESITTGARASSSDTKPTSMSSRHQAFKDGQKSFDEKERKKLEVKMREQKAADAEAHRRLKQQIEQDKIAKLERQQRGNTPVMASGPSVTPIPVMQPRPVEATKSVVQVWGVLVC